MNEQECIEKHRGLVQKLAFLRMRRLPFAIDYADLIQAGYIGLIEAHRNYDPSLGASFETYAGIRIKGAMLDEMRRHDYLPRQSAGKPRPMSYELLMETHPDVIPPSIEWDTPEKLTLLDEVQRLVREAVEKLPLREKWLAKSVFYEGAKKQDVARVIGVSPSRVSQLQNVVIGRLRNCLPQSLLG